MVISYACFVYRVSLSIYIYMYIYTVCVFYSVCKVITISSWHLLHALFSLFCRIVATHYSDVIMGSTAPQVISLMIVFSAVYSGADQSIHQSSLLLVFVRGIHRWIPVNSLHIWPVTPKMFPFDDVIMIVYHGITSLGQISMQFEYNYDLTGFLQSQKSHQRRN